MSLLQVGLHQYIKKYRTFLDMIMIMQYFNILIFSISLLSQVTVAHITSATSEYTGKGGMS
jgi:hypothetical protein